MNRVLSPLLFLTLILGACSPSLPSTETAPAVPTASSPTQPTETPVTDTNCGYQWAYQDLPELSAQFDQAVKSLILQSTSHATAFGENCLGNNGQIIRFLTMGTDFYVRTTVATLDDYQTFGNWIAGVMQVVIDFPPDMIAGPKPGFVEFRFEKSASENVALRVSIQQYKDSAIEITGEELFRMFYTQP